MVGTIIIPILQMRILMFKVVMKYMQGYRVLDIVNI